MPEKRVQVLDIACNCDLQHGRAGHGALYEDDDMNIEEYADQLEQQVPAWVVSTFGAWPVETRLYMYLHHLQLARMDEFVQLLKER
jgi:hypothetical protein